MNDQPPEPFIERGTPPISNVVFLDPSPAMTKADTNPDTGREAPKSSTTAAGPVARLPVFLLTLVWLAPLAALLCNAVFGLHTFEHRTYELGRFAVIVAMLLLALIGLLRAFDLVGSHAGDPWYVDPLLVALVLFWGLFPPMWFFVEYLSFDRGAFALPRPPQEAAAVSGNPVSGAEQVAKLKADFLASTKLYADLASKVWVAVGTALGAIIALAKRP